MAELPIIGRRRARRQAEIDAAVAKGDLQLVEKLMDLQERYDVNQARRAFDRAIAAAKQEMEGLVNRPIQLPNLNDPERKKKLSQLDPDELAKVSQAFFLLIDDRRRGLCDKGLVGQFALRFGDFSLQSQDLFGQSSSLGIEIDFYMETRNVCVALDAHKVPRLGQP